MLEQIHQHKHHLAWIAGVLIVLGLWMNWMGFYAWRDGFLMAATVAAVLPIAIKAWQAARMKTFSIELLVTVAVAGAFLIHEYMESAAVTLLFLFGDYLEARTLKKTRSSLKQLADMAPQEAILLQEDGTRKKTAADRVRVGNKLVVLPGGKIPVDGTIAKGRAFVNESAVTGEPAPVMKKENDPVFSGSILDNGYIEMIAEKVGNDTTFAKMIELVEEAQDAKSKTERFLDRFANYYTPAIVILALAVFVFTRDFHKAITFLVIACPGALVIGAPVSNVAGIGNGAKHGALIKGGDVMEKLSKVDTLVFDKTGTLTKGKPEVTDLHLLGTRREEEVLGLVAKAETVSEHPLGQTIVKEAEARGIPFNRYHLQEGEAIKGKGMTATIDGIAITVGNRKLMEAQGITISPSAGSYATDREKMGNTAIFIAVNGKLEAILSIADQIREDARAALEDMRAAGIKRIVMLTGDNRHTARAVANQLGIDAFHAELLPDEKVDYVKKLKEEGAVVAMAGDGMNDAPAIATADIGLAMGKGGTDISIETADIVLMADKLSQYAHAFALSKKTMRNMKQNIAIALSVVVFLLVGVLRGQVDLAAGMFVHEGSVLAVILNAMRLIGFAPKGGRQKFKISKIGQLDGDQLRKPVRHVK
ncbi:cation-translocating P-type ATPase [Weizmannia coagulans]|uniref:Cd(2+)-exporting ATPase n=2 Tax=Heyndrickxia TaxID=2837504 RepID=A0A0C5C8K2_HEYCO|nr:MULTISPECIES: cation-translocating P-type ATPase [Heyndrickxia]AJO24673.1 cadmium-translocating P-type ATPase [Heyndrickxia coagulans]AKN53877.1 Lead, cadmium, zinc and mercury transporting ATPase [Heyndrickxia coagulans]ATW84427.1 heavy metal translocating P-type ATPase [Heyndrickxia coagulans]KGB30224.1 HAD family hydrolase [Heyndrickxia coagulans]KWZ84909.1 cadmium-exporting ATPase [Heyndrickxia coagulans]